MQNNYQYPFRYADEKTKRLVWNKGAAIPGFDPSQWRRDVCGHAMSYTEHGNTDSQFGWEIDHIYPREKGGPTTWDNLQPLYWRTNRHKSDKVQWSCPVGI
jgi:5-methylcytosine-specific restriction endonuclease McrA